MGPVSRVPFANDPSPSSGDPSDSDWRGTKYSWHGGERWGVGLAKTIIFTVLALVLAACSTRATSTPLPADESSTPTVALTPTATHPLRLTPTLLRTPLPDELREAMLGYHELLRMILLNASVLNETARQVDSGELSVPGSTDQIAGLVEVLTLIRKLERGLSVYQPPEMFSDSWGEALQVHETTRNILFRWMTGEIDAKLVLEEMAGPIATMQENLAQVENSLIADYGFDSNLQTEYEDMLAAVSQFVKEAPTRTPTPLPESVQQAVSQTYMGALAVYGSAVLLDNLAQKVDAGIVPNSWAIEALLSTEILNGSLDQELVEIQPPAALDTYWRQVMLDHQTVKDLMRRWVSGEVDSGFVLSELASRPDSIRNILSGIEEVMVNEFGLDRNELEAVRDEYLANLEEMIASAITPESTQGSLIVLSSRSTFDGNVYKIIGEVQNTSTYQPFTYVKVTANLYDTNQQKIGKAFTYTLLNSIHPGGGKAPFELMIDDWERVASYDFEVEALAGDYRRADLYVINQIFSQSGSTMEIRGDVVNSGTAPAEDVMVIATLYDAGGSVVGVGYAYTLSKSIPAGWTAPFVISISQVEGFADYALQVQGK